MKVDKAPPSILLVDDNESNLDVSRRMMVKLGYIVEIVDNGPDAIEMVKNKPYDVIFLDMLMPGMDGKETAIHIRELPGPRVILIGLSGNNPSEGGLIPALLDDYLCKPVRMDDFRKMISKWIKT